MLITILYNTEIVFELLLLVKVKMIIHIFSFSVSQNFPLGICPPTSDWSNSYKPYNTVIAGSIIFVRGIPLLYKQVVSFIYARSWLSFFYGVRLSSVVRAFAHGAMCHRIDPSRWTHWAISRSSQCSTTGVTKAVVCVILSVGWCI